MWLLWQAFFYSKRAGRQCWQIRAALHVRACKKEDSIMKDLLDILASLGTPLFRGTKAVLTGKAGREVCHVAWLVVIIQALRAISHATGVIGGTLLFGALMVTAAVSVLTAFMTGGGNEYEPNPGNVKSRKGVYIAMVFNGTLLGAIVGAILVGLVALVCTIKEPGYLMLYSVGYAAIHSSLGCYLLGKKANNTR